jgi:hypothetical protein
MDDVQEHSDYDGHTTSSEPFRIYYLASVLEIVFISWHYTLKLLFILFCKHVGIQNRDLKN